MNDRELLELAAKAAGIEIVWEEDGRWCYVPDHYPPHNRRESDQGQGRIWNPLESDGDALRLAVKLNLAVQTLPGRNKPASEAWHNDKYARELWDGDPYAATRRAIVRAAAAIGKALP